MGWQEIATTEVDIIADWWRRAPHALPAIPCGVNGLLVIDLDRHGNGSDGVRAFKELSPAMARCRQACRRSGLRTTGCISIFVSRRASRSATAAAVFRPAVTCEAAADM